MIKEEWKDIKGYEGLYQVSNLGMVYSFKSNKYLKKLNNTGGYLRVQLCKHGKVTNQSIHRIVAEAFIPNPDNKPQVNHIDENKENNMVSNLEWVTAKENCNHGTRSKRLYKPIRAIDIANGEYNHYVSVGGCAEKLNLKYQNISAVLNGRQKTAGGYVFEYIK